MPTQFNIHEYVDQVSNYEWIVTKHIDCGSYVIPPGFKFNGGSVPRLLWNIVAPGDYLYSFLRHDYAYATQSITRERADSELRENVFLEGASRALASSIYYSVRLFGASHYDKR